MSFTKKLLEVVRQFAICVMSRKEAIIIYSWLSVIGLFIVYRGIPPIILFLKLFGAVTGTALSVYFINDILDLESDIRAREVGSALPSNRPLGAGIVSKSMMVIFALILAVSGMALSLLIDYRVFLLQLAFLVLGIIYSAEPIRLKRRFLLKRLTVALGGVIACISAGVSAGAITGQLLYLVVIYVVLIFGAGPLVDLRDMKGDIVTGVKTVPIVWGPEFTVKLALAAFIAMAIAGFVGFYGLGFNIALPIMGTAVLLAWTYVTYPLLTHWRDNEFVEKAVHKRGLPLYFVLQIIVALGSIRI